MEIPGTILYSRTLNLPFVVRGYVDGLIIIKDPNVLGPDAYELLEPDDIGPRGMYNTVPASAGPWEEIQFPSGSMGWVRKPLDWPEVQPSEGYIVAPGRNPDGVYWYGSISLDPHSTAELAMERVDRILRNIGRETLQAIGIILLIVLLVGAMIGFLIWDEERKLRPQRACNDACWPRAAKIIDSDCHCGAPEGWLRAETETLP